MFCSRCHRQSQQDCKHLLGRRCRQSAVLLHWRLTSDAVKSEREQISKIRARHGTRNDETFSAIASRTDEREACEQEVVHQKGGQRTADLTVMVHTCAQGLFLLSPVSSDSYQNGTIRQRVASRGRGELDKGRGEGLGHLRPAGSARLTS